MEFDPTKREHIPLYIQIKDDLFIRIINKEFKVNSTISPIPQLMEEYNVSRITIRKAIKELVDEGILKTVIGKGTYVIKDKVSDLQGTGEGFTSTIEQMNREPSTKIISVTEQSVGKDIAEILEIDEGKKIWCITRLRLLDRMPYIYEVDYINKDFKFIKNYTAENQSLFNLFKTNGYEICSVQNTVEVTNINSKMSEHLRIKKSTPVVKINETVLTSGEKVLYFNEQYVNSNVGNYGFRIKLKEE